jgi:hypothetical protein
MIIDLCCGKGRFPGEDVISIDIDRKVKPTILADIRYLPLKENLKPRLVHASPPCKYFSSARARRYGYDETGLAESFRLVAACFEAFAWLKPYMWTLENPLGVMRRFLKPDAETEYQAYDLKHKRTDFWSNNRSLKRALIPMDIRQKLLNEAKQP